MSENLEQEDTENNQNDYESNEDWFDPELEYYAYDDEYIYGVDWID